MKWTITGVSFAGKMSVTVFLLRLTLNEIGVAPLTASKVMLSRITSAMPASVMVTGVKPKIEDYRATGADRHVLAACKTAGDVEVEGASYGVGRI